MKEFIKKLGSSQLFKTLIILLIILISAYLIVLLAFEIIPMYQLSMLENSNIVSIIKNVFQTLFFIITSILAILSYLQAKETLFNPIRTEIFKLQISEFEKLLLFFQNKTETDYSDVFDTYKILHVNASLMVDDFVETFFKDERKIDIKKRKEMMVDFTGVVVSEEYEMEHFHSFEYYQKPQNPENVEITNPALILQKWQKYKYGKIEFTKKFSDNSAEIEGFLSSPLLPEELKTLLTDFNKVVQENLSLVEEVLSDISQELPEKFPNFKKLDDLDLTGIWNTYNKKSKSYEEPAKEILKYINKYLKIERLIEASN